MLSPIQLGFTPARTHDLVGDARSLVEAARRAGEGVGNAHECKEFIGLRHRESRLALQRAASMIVRDSAFLALQGDPNSHVFAEQRVLEILDEALSPHVQTQSAPDLSDMIANTLRAEINALQDQIVDRDEKITFVTRAFQALEERASAAKKEEELTGMMRQAEFKKMTDLILRLRNELQASANETQRVQQHLERAVADNNGLAAVCQDLRLAVKAKGEDKTLEKSIGQLHDALAFEMARARNEQNSVGELLMRKDAHISHLEKLKTNAEMHVEQLLKDEGEVAREACLKLKKELERELNAERGRGFALQVENASLRREMEMLKARTDELQEKNVDLHRENERLRLKLTQNQQLQPPVSSPGIANASSTCLWTPSRGNEVACESPMTGATFSAPASPSKSRVRESLLPDDVSGDHSGEDRTQGHMDLRREVEKLKAAMAQNKAAGTATWNFPASNHAPSSETLIRPPRIIASQPNSPDKRKTGARRSLSAADWLRSRKQALTLARPRPWAASP